jgi:hypothetical protein
MVFLPLREPAIQSHISWWIQHKPGIETVRHGLITIIDILVEIHATVLMNFGGPVQQEHRQRL